MAKDEDWRVEVDFVFEDYKYGKARYSSLNPQFITNLYLDPSFTQVTGGKMPNEFTIIMVPKRKR